MNLINIVIININAIKSLKRTLTERDAVIHMDFSENFSTECNQEMQGMWFWRFPYSNFFADRHCLPRRFDSFLLHCFFKFSHSAVVIWVHLQPMFISLSKLQKICTFHGTTLRQVTGKEFQMVRQQLANELQ